MIVTIEFYQVSFARKHPELWTKKRMTVSRMEDRALAALIVNENLPNYDAPSVKVTITVSAKRAAKSAWRNRYTLETKFSEEWQIKAHTEAYGS